MIFHLSSRFCYHPELAVHLRFLNFENHIFMVLLGPSINHFLKQEKEGIIPYEYLIARKDNLNMLFTFVQNGVIFHVSDEQRPMDASKLVLSNYIVHSRLSFKK
jgi:hypothetical protein